MFTAQSVLAQVPEADILFTTLLPEVPNGVQLVETELSVHPDDPSFLVASAMSTDARASFVFVSRDGGRTWSEGRRFPGADPTFAFDSTHGVLFSTITPELRLWSSTDGVSWVEWPETERAFDRQWLASDQAGDFGFLAAGKTTPMNGGRGQSDVPAIVQWEPESRSVSVDELNTPAAGFLHVVTDALFANDGTLHLTYYVHLRSTGQRPAELSGQQMIMSSSDGGHTWSHPVIVGERIDYGNGNRTMAMKGLGGGGLSMDETGGPHHGNAYIVWTSAPDGFYQIELARSIDDGLSWNEPVVVSRSPNGSNSSTPAVAVTDKGTVVVAWYDRRDDPNDRCLKLYAAHSTDGGRTFSNALPLPHDPPCFDEGSRWMNGGDTLGLQPLGRNSVGVVWTSSVEGRLRPLFSVIRLE